MGSGLVLIIAKWENHMYSRDLSWVPPTGRSQSMPICGCADDIVSAFVI